MLIIESGVTQPMPHGRENASNGYPDEGEYKDVEEEMGYQQTLMYGRYSRCSKLKNDISSFKKWD